MPAAQPGRWLTLTQAARLLGVHPVTLRTWADRGAVECIRTIGGHRRFSEATILQSIAEQDSLHSRERIGSMLLEHGLAHTRRLIAEPPTKLLPALDEAERELRRADGRALLALVIRYVSYHDEAPELVEEAKKFGVRYAEAGLSSGLALTDAVAAALFFRDSFVEALVDTPTVVHVGAGDNGRMVGRVNRLLNAVQLAIIDRYEHGHG